jgi:hypothetical protein
VIANAEHVALVDGLTLYTLAHVLHAVGRTHVDNEVLTTQKLDQRVLARHVRIFDGQIAALFAATDDEAVFGDRETLPHVVNIDRAAGRPCYARRRRSVLGRS